MLAGMVGCLVPVLLVSWTWAGQSAHRSLEGAFGSYPAGDSGSGLLLTSGILRNWSLRLGKPCVWTDGSKDDYLTADLEVAGTGVCLPAPEEPFPGVIWCTVEEHGDARLNCCRAFVPLPGPLQKFGVRSWHCRPPGRVMWVLTIARSSGRLLATLGQGLRPYCCNPSHDPCSGSGCGQAPPWLPTQAGAGSGHCCPAMECVCLLRKPLFRVLALALECLHQHLQQHLHHRVSFLKSALPSL